MVITPTGRNMQTMRGLGGVVTIVFLGVSGVRPGTRPQSVHLP